MIATTREPPPLAERMAAGLRGGLAYLPRTLRIVWRSSRPATLLLFLGTLGSAFAPLGIAYVGKLITDAVVAHDRDRTILWVVAELALIVLQTVLTRVLGLTRQTLGARLSIDINVLILERALTLELRDFEDPDFYDRLVRARREASSRPLSLVMGFFQLAQNVITLAAYSVVLVRFSVLAMLALLVAAVPATLVEIRYSSLAFRQRNRRAPESRKLSYIEHVLANDEHAKEVKTLGIGGLLLERYKDLSEGFYREDLRLLLRRAAWGLGLALVGTVAFYASYGSMAIAAAVGQITLGTMVFYVAAFRQGQQGLQSILSAVGQMYEDTLYMSNLYLYLDAAKESLPASPSANGTVAPKATNGVRHGAGVVFEGVGFRYPGSERWSLRDVDLTIAPGEKLALVGHNGAGKTTFIKLLTRLYDPTEGRILLDGKDLRDWDRNLLLARIGVVFQDFNEYQFHLEENVGLGSAAFLGDDARIDRAIDQGGAREVVEGLPRGKKTQLGRWFKDGVELSGGQWQKVALARAFMREEADILVLDEPTAALDAEAEHAVFERFKTLAQGRTAILISHRFPTVRMADRIIVLEGGRVIEEGTHRVLLERGGEYARLFELQAHGYQ